MMRMSKQPPIQITNQTRNCILAAHGDLARSFWARNETPQEKTLIEQAFDSTFATSTTVADTQNGMFFLCTAMLASLDSQKY